MAGRGDEAAYASNWTSVLAVDAALGVVVLAVGIGLVARGSRSVGGLAVAGGLLYVGLTVRRFLRWRRLRGEVPPAT